MKTLVELCCGTAALSLWALGRAVPLTGYMGSKRRWAPLLVEALGCDKPERVILVDAGPWGDAWSVLKTPKGRASVQNWLHQLDVLVEAEGLEAAWKRALEDPSEDPGRRVAHFLWLQARSAGTIPVWWSGSRWESPTGSRTEDAHQRGSALALRQKGGARADGPAYEAGGLERRRAERGGVAAPKRRGMQRPRTLLRRVAALEALPLDRLEVLHCDVRAVDPVPGAVVYIDPPYVGCPRYAATLPRFDVLDLASRWADAGARVAVSEAEPLSLRGWTSRPLPSAKPEWVTANWPIAIEEQLKLWEAA